ncbi:BICD family-like cargo adapter 1 [Eubalaena glacialis]|uniref:BICD family-like cargo adapter 1 n=1 Tax=Eubalaena glacialis TaxID=27606 RepID=UPI002A59D1A3|nr:BICD family-like cargo adapter 1 [Eubalaena glacialis]
MIHKTLDDLDQMLMQCWRASLDCVDTDSTHPGRRRHLGVAEETHEPLNRSRAQRTEPRGAGTGVRGAGAAGGRGTAVDPGEHPQDRPGPLADVAGLQPPPPPPPPAQDTELLSVIRQKDLVLAALVGKALLERNQDMSRQYEQMHKELTDKLEVQLSLLFSIVPCLWTHCQEWN